MNLEQFFEWIGHKRADIPVSKAVPGAGLPLILEGPVRLGGFRGTEPGNFARGHVFGLPVSNFGGPGKGIFVIAEGEILERDDISITGVKLWSPGQRLSFPFEPQTAGFLPAVYDGRAVYRADFPDFIIPRGVNPEYQHERLSKQMRFDHEHSIILNFTVEADEPVENLVLRIVPMENPDGEYIYRQADCNYRSADTEEMENGNISSNELIKRKRTFK